ncbi:MAG: hypothetical protein M3N21_07720 [Actinomycetota bacterium]|nr:hypothetical protein [Actinomycetota bacterium]
MRLARGRLARTALSLAALGAVLAPQAGGASAAPAVYAGPTPGVACDRTSLPEKTQGRAPLSDVATGRYALGYSCNAQMVSHFGTTGGYRVERYVDTSGHVCAFYDSTLLFPKDVPEQGTEGPGVYVMDMHDPAHPILSTTLQSPAMLSPHESVRLNVKRGLLVADMGYPTANPGFVDVWDVSQNCLKPTLRGSSPLGVFGHEGGFSPDGLTFYVASLYFHTLAAVDLTNPAVPSLLWLTTDYQPHGVSISEDGNRLYMAESPFQTGFRGLTVLDVSQVQKRVLNPAVPIISRLTWPQVGTPQNATPFTRGGHKYLMEIDEFGSGAHIGAARIIDVQDEKRPFVVSNMRLAVNQEAAQTPDLKADPGADQQFQGYQGHYCTLPSRVDPTIVACSFIMSGLRVFDISVPSRPREIAYFNKPLVPKSKVNPMTAGAFAMAAPAYDPVHGDIWYSDGNSGFYVVRLTGVARAKPFARSLVLPGN